MKPQTCSGLLALCVLASPVVFAAEAKPPAKAGETVVSVVPGDFGGTWQQTGGDSRGQLRLKLKREGDGWTAEAVFTFENADIPATVKTVKVQGAKVELVFDWTIQTTSGQSRLTGELSDGRLQGTYESKTESGTTNGTWAVSRT
jgi:hypothetical protein